jgi:hypothetical protein
MRTMPRSMRLARGRRTQRVRSLESILLARAGVALGDILLEIYACAWCAGNGAVCAVEHDTTLASLISTLAERHRVEVLALRDDAPMLADDLPGGAAQAAAAGRCDRAAAGRRLAGVKELRRCAGCGELHYLPSWSDARWCYRCVVVMPPWRPAPFGRIRKVPASVAARWDDPPLARTA